MKLYNRIIHIEKQEVWEPRQPTPEEAAALSEELLKTLQRHVHTAWGFTITPEEQAELWNNGKGRDHPNVIEGEYEEVKPCRALPE